MIDLQLPRPFLDPSRWPPGAATLSIFSLKYGGPLAARRGLSFVVPETFWIHEANDEPSLVAVLRDLRLDGAEIVARSPLAAAEQDEWRKLGASSFRVDTSLRIPSLLDWSREVFPLALAEAGEVVWLRDLREYETQMGGGLGSLDRLRFWPAFLRTRRAPYAGTASVEWARVQALFSPQDDARAAAGSFVLMNPTLQVVTSGKQMLAAWRVDGRLFEADLSWEEAAVLDEMRETPRILRTALAGELSSRSFQFTSHRPFAEVITEMIRTGIILLRAN